MSQSNTQTPFRERRKGPDKLSKSLRWLTIVAWLVFIVCMILTHYARPEMDTGLVRYWDLEIRAEWHPQLTRLLIYLLWLCLGLSLLSLGINRLRLRRRTDHLHFNIILLLLTCGSLLLYLWWV
ncbi:hypothetical protein QE250_08955 [Chromatiaceae bacterium AAb-1]|nr:hypothetical protein [Chromatiaceae bacterium AAb-1]